jgi:DNA-binding transcriptional regulator YiaG
MDGNEMKQLRKDSGLLGKEIAKEMGVTPETVSRWERGVHKIDLMAEKFFRNIVEDGDLVDRIRKNRRIRRMSDKSKRNLKAMNDSTH